MSAMEELDALPLADVTNERVAAAIAERIDYMTMHGGVAMPVHEFWRPGDLDNYRAAADWWPDDAPQSCALPTLRELVMYAAAPPGASNALVPASDVLSQLGSRCVLWLQVEGRDPANPRESADQRKRRLNRERVRRHRQLVREVEGEEPGVARARQLHAAYMAACAARREALAAVHEQHDPLVESARVAWQEARGS